MQRPPMLKPRPNFSDLRRVVDSSPTRASGSDPRDRPRLAAAVYCRRLLVTTMRTIGPLRPLFLQHWILHVGLGLFTGLRRLSLGFRHCH